MKYIFIICLLFLLTSCAKEEGLGGKIKLSGFTEHHEVAIPNSRVFIKFGAREFPGTDTSLYDLATSADGTAYYEVSELQKGYYYLYSVGYDPGISQEVRGGIPVQLRKNKDATANVPITED